MDLDLDADVRQQRRDVLGSLALPRAGVVTGIRRVDADEVAAQVDDLGSRVVRRGRRGLLHRPILAPGTPGVAATVTAGLVPTEGPPLVT